MSQDNLMLGPDAQANHTLALLRGMALEGDMVSGEELVPGLWFDIDPAAEAEGQYSSREGELISARFNVPKPGQWLGLHVNLGTARLSSRSLVGLVCRSTAPEPVTARICLRTGVGDGFTDRFFTKRMISFDKPSMHLDALQLTGAEGGALEETWRQIIIFFDVRSFEMTIEDLRLFLV